MKSEDKSKVLYWPCTVDHLDLAALISTRRHLGIGWIIFQEAINGIELALIETEFIDEKIQNICCIAWTDLKDVLIAKKNDRLVYGLYGEGFSFCYRRNQPEEIVDLPVCLRLLAQFTFQFAGLVVTASC